MTQKRSPASPGRKKKASSNAKKKAGARVKTQVSRAQLIGILEQWREIFDTLADIVIVLDTEGNILRCNRALANFLALPFQAFIGRNCHEVFPDLSGFLGELRSRQTRTTKVLEIGSRWYSIAADPLADQGGKIRGWACIISDISEKKKTDDLLRHTNQTLEALIQSSPLAIFTFDRQGRIMLWNPAAATIFGWSKTEAEGSILPFAPTKKSDEAFTMIRTILAGKGFQGTLRRWQRKDGREIDINLYSAPIRDVEGRIQSFMGIASNVTEQLRLEEEHRHSEERFRLLFEESPLGIAIFRKGTVLIANRAFLAIFDYGDLGEVRGCALQRFIDEASRPLLEEMISDPQRGKAIELSGLKKGGLPFPIYSEIGSIVLSDGPAVVIFVVDLSERKILEERLIQAQKMESLGQLAAGISHDFNNIITGITGYTEMASLHVHPPHPLHDAIDHVRQLTERAASITRKLLAFSRRQVMKPKPVDLNAIVSDMLRLLGNTLGGNVDIRFHPDPVLRTAYADATQMEQVLMNLCLNARDAMPRGGQLDIRTANIAASAGDSPAPAPGKPDHYVLLEVTDTGCGMNKEVLSKIFEPFFTTKEADKGTGLGLAMVHGIIAQHGGHIDVLSEVGKGTTFKIYLPATTGSG